MVNNNRKSIASSKMKQVVYFIIAFMTYSMTVPPAIAKWVVERISSLRPLRSLDRRELFVHRTRTTMAKSRSFSVAGPSLWNYLQLVLLSYHPIFLRPYHFLKLVSCLRANRTKIASVCRWLLCVCIFVLYHKSTGWQTATQLHGQ